MTTTIDKAGRVVIPAAVRKQLHLAPGTELEVRVEEFSVRLVRAVPGAKLVRVGKRLIARPTVDPKKVPPVDIARLIRRERDRRPW